MLAQVVHVIVTFNRPLRCQHSFPALPGCVGFLLHPDSQCCSSTLAPEVFRKKKSTIVLSSSLLNESPAQHTSPICTTRHGRRFSPALMAVCCCSSDEERDGDSVPLNFDRCLIDTRGSVGHVVALHLDFDLFERPRPEERIRRSFDDAALWTALPRNR